MQNQTQKWLILNGLIQLLFSMLSPFYSPWAKVQEGIVLFHLIGITQALLFFTFAWIWPKLTLPKYSNKLALSLLCIAFWANLLGIMLVAIFGSGRAEFITNQNLIPGDSGFWNTLTLLLLNGSEYIIIPILIAILGLRNKFYSKTSEKWLNGSMILLTLAFTILIICQTFIPSISNG